MTDRTQYETAVARYFEAWNATDPEARAKAVAAAWTEDGGSTDPPPATAGRCPLPPSAATTSSRR